MHHLEKGVGPCATFSRGPDGTNLMLRSQRLLQSLGGKPELLLLEQVIAPLFVCREGEEQYRFDSVAFINKGVTKFGT